MMTGAIVIIESRKSRGKAMRSMKLLPRQYKPIPLTAVSSGLFVCSTDAIFIYYMHLFFWKKKNDCDNKILQCAFSFFRSFISPRTTGNSRAYKIACFGSQNG